MKICVIGIVGIPASYGGFETLVENLVESDTAEFQIYCSSFHYPNKLKKYKRASLIYIPIRANGISSIFYDIASMIHAIVTGHRNFLVLGVSGAIFFPILRCFSSIKLVTNIDGIEWRRNKWNRLAKIFLKVSERIAINFSTHVVSDNDAITDYVSKEYKSSCKTIAYGGDHAIQSAIKKDIKNYIDNDKPYAIGLCRIEPENNIHIILDAFSITKLQIVFIGNWQHSIYGLELFKKYKSYKNITLLDPIYCIDTLYALRSSCSVYIHGHSAGGTNPSLVEMMHFSKPIIAYDCIFNRATMENKGYYFRDSSDLKKLINRFNKLSCGPEMKEIASRKYTWDIVNRKYLEMFNL